MRTRIALNFALIFLFQYFVAFVDATKGKEHVSKQGNGSASIGGGRMHSTRMHWPKKNSVKKRHRDSLGEEGKPSKKLVATASAGESASARETSTSLMLDEIVDIFSGLSIGGTKNKAAVRSPSPASTKPKDSKKANPKPSTEQKPKKERITELITENIHDLPQLSGADVPSNYKSLRDGALDTSKLSAMLYLMELMKLSSIIDVGEALKRLNEHTKNDIFSELLADYKASSSESQTPDLVFWKKFYARLLREVYTNSYSFMDVNLRVALEYATLNLGYKIVMATKSDSQKPINQYFTPLEDIIELFQIIIEMENKLNKDRNGIIIRAYKDAFEIVNQQYSFIKIPIPLTLETILHVVFSSESDDNAELWKKDKWPYMLPLYLPNDGDKKMGAKLRIFFSSTNNLTYALSYRKEQLNQCKMNACENKSIRYCLYANMANILQKIKTQMFDKYVLKSAELEMNHFVALYKYVELLDNFITGQLGENYKSLDANYAKIFLFVTSPFLCGAKTLGIMEAVDTPKNQKNDSDKQGARKKGDSLRSGSQRRRRESFRRS